MTSKSNRKHTSASYQSILKRRRYLSKKAFEIVFSRPPGFSFKSGQSIQLIHKGLRRDYTLVSGSQEEELALCIRLVESGRVSKMLQQAPLESRFHFSGPSGFFFFHPSPRKAVFIATGTGIAPFCSMARSGIKNFILLHGVATSTDLYYADELSARAAAYIACLSASSNPQPFGEVFNGWVTDYLKAKLAADQYDFYLCGRKEMIRDVTLLIDDIFQGSRIYTETFF